MSGLWGDDEVEVPANGEFSSGGGDFELLPEGTRVLFEVEQAEIRQYEDIDNISLRWSVLQPELYKNRKIFQNVYVFADDKEKRMKARKMLAAIDVNADNRLTKYAEKKKISLNEFTTEDLTICLVGQSMTGTIGKYKDKNIVRGISPANSAKIKEPTKTAPKKEIDEDEDLPF